MKQLEEQLIINVKSFTGLFIGYEADFKIVNTKKQLHGNSQMWWNKKFNFLVEYCQQNQSNLVVSELISMIEKLSYDGAFAIARRDGESLGLGDLLTVGKIINNIEICLDNIRPGWDK